MELANRRLTPTHSDHDGGNTGPRRSRRWCFTVNNPEESDIQALKTAIESHANNKGVFQRETGENGTEHLQGAIWFHSQRNLNQLRSLCGRAHWEIQRGTWEQNVAYCSKEDTRTGGLYSFNTDLPERIKTIQPHQFYQWQKEIIELISQEPDDRKILWYWEPNGKMGKTQFAKYLCVHKGAIVLSGRAADMKFAVKAMCDKGKPPKIIIFDIERSRESFVSYAGIEEVKNGLFFSPKYEGGMVIYNPPHLFVFANFPPDEAQLSADRWDIKDIT